jgi:topoisomerase IA-like protein
MVHSLFDSSPNLSAIQSTNRLKKALRFLVKSKRVRTYAYKPLIEKGLIPTSSRNFLYEVNEPSEQRIERKTKDYRKYPRQTMELLGLDPKTGRPFEEKKEEESKVIEIDADFKELG